MKYINIGSESASVKDVPKGHPSKVTVKQIYKYTFSRYPDITKGSTTTIECHAQTWHY